VITMKQIYKETVTCTKCDATFPADELLMGSANDDHGIDDWHCPYCGSSDYEIDDGTDEPGW
jgi:Zn finger protein HypA/HybF involved in hydrogenase expression